MRKKVNHSLKLIDKALKQYGDRVAVASSFGKDSIVTLHLCRIVKPDIQVFSIMTPFKFKETLEYKDYITAEWNLNLRTYVAPMLGMKLYKTEGVEKCCDYYKVQPTKKAIKELNLSAWISGLRGTEGHTREFLDEVEVKDGLVKINPILKWTEADVWLYHSHNHIVPHPLYFEGYRSLGCEPCSRPNTETERGGRWEGTDKSGGECGIHTKSLVSQEEMPLVDVYGIPKRNSGKF